MSKYAKLAPWLCGPFTILSPCSDNNIATTETLVTSEGLVSKPHVLEKILDVKTKTIAF